MFVSGNHLRKASKFISQLLQLLVHNPLKCCVLYFSEPYQLTHINIWEGAYFWPSLPPSKPFGFSWACPCDVLHANIVHSEGNENLCSIWSWTLLKPKHMAANLSWLKVKGGIKVAFETRRCAFQTGKWFTISNHNKTPDIAVGPICDSYLCSSTFP